MAGQSSGVTDDTIPLNYEIVATLEGDAVHLTHDDKYLYAACKDNLIRVWSKKDWQQVAVLGETTSPPRAVHVDEEQVYATCERRVYVWRKDEFGMIGWFELTYPAITSTLQGDRFYVGAEGGRLVSIKKDTHDTSSWQLHKSDITNLWSDDEVICTATKKEAPIVWRYSPTSAPTEILQLEKEKEVEITGNKEVILVGSTTGNIDVWDRIEWKLDKKLKSKSSGAIASMWSSYPYLLIANTQSFLTIWDVRNGMEIGQIKLNGVKFDWAMADGNHLYVASSEGVMIIDISISETPLDLSSEEHTRYTGTLLRTSPYDVLEEVLTLQSQGDQLFHDGKFPESVTEFENALQLLIDNSHALIEVPEEREQLTRSLNTRLGRALLRSKILELVALNKEIERLSDELDMKGKTIIDTAELDNLWVTVGRAIKESRVLAEAQAGNILSYQLSYVVDNLESDVKAAKEKLAKYKETVNQAKALTHSIASEWRWMERRKTTLDERLGFLERAISQLEERLKEADEDSEVKEILSTALSTYRRLFEQISRILSVADEISEDEELASRDEAVAAIDGLLKVLPKKRDTILAIVDKEEQALELELLVTALEQAQMTAEKFKLKDLIRDIQNALTSLKGETETPEKEPKPKTTKKTPKKRKKKKTTS